MKNFFFSMIVLLAVAQAFAQRTVSGKVTDDTGESLPGATVQEKSTSNGTITGPEGNYTLNVAEGAVLVVSFVGYVTQKVELTAALTLPLNIAMQNDLLLLDELVVTGTSVLTSKKQLGNAISTLKSKDLSHAGSQGLTASFSGKIPGALVNQNSGNPAGGVSVRLRGASTVFGVSDPLYVVDGIIVDNSSTELLPLGGYAQNRLVDLNPNDIDRIEVIKGAAAAAIYGSRASNGVVQVFTKKGKPGKMEINFSTSINIHQLRKQIEENMEPFQFQKPGSSELVPVTRYKMQDRIFGTAIGTNNNLSIGSGSEKTQYFTSTSYTNNQGIIRNTDFKRYTFRLNLDHQFNDWLDVSLYSNYAASSSRELPNGGMLAPGEFFGVLTGFAFLNTNYNPDRQTDGTYINNLGFTLAANPVAAIETYDFSQRTDRVIGGINVQARPFEGFSIDLIIGYDGSTSRATAFIPRGILPKVTGWSRTAEKTALLLNTDLNFAYTDDISGTVTSTTTMGLTQQYDRTTLFSLTSDQMAPGVETTAGGTTINRIDTRSQRSIRGAFLQQTFGFDDKIFLTGAIRVDQASTFGPDERTQFYPKASFSYLVSDENFWSQSIGQILNVFKLRASYGQSGNLTALSAFDRLINYNPTPIRGRAGLVPDDQAGNNRIKPERQTEIEIGFEMGLLDGKLGLEFSYYDVDVQDLLLGRVLAPTTGYASRLENVGTLTNKGFEILLAAQPVKNNAFSWDITAIYSRNRNRVSNIEGGQLILPDVFDQAVVAKNGYPIGVFNGTYFQRDANGNIAVDDNGLPITSADKKIIGDPNPDWTGSFINELSYKNWSFRAQFDGMIGFDVFNWTDRLNSHTDLFGGGRRDAQEIRGELPRGYNSATFQTFERYIEDGSFVKLRELSLTYNFPFKSKAVTGLALSFIGRNLFSFDNYSGWDPEVSSFGQRNGFRGMDFNEVPIPRTYQLRVDLNF